MKDAERSLGFYRDTLGFSLDWNHQEQNRAHVFQVSLLGFELILNQTDPSTEDRAGHGRLFIGLDDDQVDAFRKHIEENCINSQAPNHRRRKSRNDPRFWRLAAPRAAHATPEQK